ncbi:MAG: prepilin-type N-terminal cleavage/methylation domain-containing protein [Patescibacteria group bacterium]
MFELTKTKSNNYLGFSLVEVMVATAILAVGLLAVMSIFPFSLQANKGAEQTSLASSYAKAKLEQLLVTPYDELGVGNVEPRAKLSSDPDDLAYSLERQTEVTLLDGNLVSSGSDVGLKKIAVSVFWSNRQGGDKSLVLTSILSQK